MGNCHKAREDKNGRHPGRAGVQENGAGEGTRITLIPARFRHSPVTVSISHAWLPSMPATRYSQQACADQHRIFRGEMHIWKK